MAVASHEVIRQRQPSLREAGVSTTPIALPSSAQTTEHQPSPNSSYIRRPTNPLLEPPDPGPEPEYGTVTAKEWELWVAAKETRSEFFLKRNRAEGFAQDNDLRGTF